VRHRESNSRAYVRRGNGPCRQRNILQSSVEPPHSSSSHCTQTFIPWPAPFSLIPTARTCSLPFRPAFCCAQRAMPPALQHLSLALLQHMCRYESCMFNFIRLSPLIDSFIHTSIKNFDFCMTEMHSLTNKIKIAWDY
jgi:hypothetical protein